ncbi:hypothetical protein BIW11_11100, partial [Tropilaelaps mercedesae]
LRVSGAVDYFRIPVDPDGDDAEAEKFSLTEVLMLRWKMLTAEGAPESGERVRVIHHDRTSLGVQLLRLDVERLRELESVLAQKSRTTKPCQPSQLKEEALVAAQKKDSVVRGVVCTVIGKKARVYLLDYGITETLNIDQLCDLPTEMVTQVPIYGVRVLLDKEGLVSAEHGSLIPNENTSLTNRIVRLGWLSPRTLTTVWARLLSIGEWNPGLENFTTRII